MAAGPWPLSNLKRRLSTLDASFLYGESRSGPLHIGGVTIFEGEIPFDDAYRYMAQRIHLVPRFRQRLVFAPFNVNHAILADDPEFKLKNHFKRVKLRSTTEAGMMREALKIYEPMLDRNKPLWEIYMIEGLKGRSVMLSKVHHALIDGVSGMELARLTSDFTPDAEPPPPPAEAWNPPPLPRGGAAFVAASRDYLKALRDSSGLALEELARHPGAVAERARRLAVSMGAMARLFARPIVATPWNAALVSSKRNAAWCKYPFADFRAVRTAFGGTVNDVVLTILSEAAARYLKHHGYRRRGEFRIGCPVNVRRPEEQTDLGNRVSMMFPMLPAHPINVMGRHRKVRKETERIKTEELPQTLDRIQAAGEVLSPTLIGLISRIGTLGIDASSALVRMASFRPRPGGLRLPALGINFIATNVPGFQVPTYFCGRKCLDSIAFFPLVGNIGYGVAISSYNQYMYFSMTGEPNLIPDIDLMKKLSDEVFEELKARALAESAKVKPARLAV